MVVIRWIVTLLLAALLGKLIAKLKMPSILGWLIAGMILGPHAVNLLPEKVLDASWYGVIQILMNVGMGLMLGTELVWSRIKRYGRALMITTLTQSLGTFAVVSTVFAVVFHFTGIPEWLGLAFGGIALATAPAPALSITREFHTSGPVTDTLLPMAVLDDVVGVVVFFTVNSFIARQTSAGSVPLYMIPVMIFLPIAIGLIPGFIAGFLLNRVRGHGATLAVIMAMVCLTSWLGWMCNTHLMSGIDLNYMLMGVSFSTVFSNRISEKQLDQLIVWYDPILAVCLLGSIVNLGAPLDYHLILGAGVYTVVYIGARAFGKYFGARFGATITHMPETVQKYLGLTLLPHSGVSLVFTGIICTTLAAAPELSRVVQGTIAAAAVINEIIAVIVARKGFALAGEIPEKANERSSADA
jgi:Kef-type K+ transport system membrane component KefB